MERGEESGQRAGEALPLIAIEPRAVGGPAAKQAIAGKWPGILVAGHTQELGGRHGKGEERGQPGEGADLNLKQRYRDGPPRKAKDPLVVDFVHRVVPAGVAPPRPYGRQRDKLS